MKWFLGKAVYRKAELTGLSHVVMVVCMYTHTKLHYAGSDRWAIKVLIVYATGISSLGISGRGLLYHLVADPLTGHARD